jgi:hypothetical protein
MTTTSTTSRATAKAGTMQAGDTIAADQSLPDLLAFNTTAAGVRVGDLLRERLASAEAAVTAHAAGAEEAQLRGDAAERAHADEAARLGREVARVRLAIEKADRHLAEVAAAERQADARAKLKAAAKAAARAEAIAADEYPAAARAVAALLDELAAVQREVVEARCAAHDAGLGDEAAALQLPHERRSWPAVHEEVEIEEVNHGPRITDAAGNPVTAGGVRHWGTSAAQPKPIVTRRRERQLVKAGNRAPDLTAATVLLPDPASEGAHIVKQGER